MCDGMLMVLLVMHHPQPATLIDHAGIQRMMGAVVVAVVVAVMPHRENPARSGFRSIG